ncbi:MAG: NADH-quinone oxidoreductase subunit N [Candidatus Omnitrophica bacterium]|nr:NADH-quinone oxidoreductase subunit N [Candidatus Omnitrophota bacterium]
MSGDLAGILPEIVVAGGGLLLLVLPRVRAPRLLGLITLAFLAAAFDLKLLAWSARPFPQSLFYGLLKEDGFSLFFQLLILVSIGFVTLSIMGYGRQEVKARRELYALLLLTTVGLMLVVGAQHLALVYVGLETISLFSYLLTGFLKRESLSAEGALKYFLFGSLASGVLLYGISLLYGLTGTMDLPGLADRLTPVMAQAHWAASISLLFLLVGLSFKVALVPFHMWAPDAYEGAPTPVAAFLSLGPKLAGFALLVRVFLVGISPQLGLWPDLLVLLSILTMTVGNLAALAQTNVKRLLAYSSIAQAGTMAIGLAVATPMGLTATLYYLLAYLLMNVGAFVGVIAVGNAGGREDLGAFSGLSRKEPLLAAMIAVSFLSLAGIPPMAGFFAKLWIFGAALKANAVGLAVVAAVNSVVALFYYMKVVKAMYLDPPTAGAPAIPRSRSLGLALGLCTVGLFAVGLWPGIWLTLSANALPFPLPAGRFP